MSQSGLRNVVLSFGSLSTTGLFSFLHMLIPVFQTPAYLTLCSALREREGARKGGREGGRERQKESHSCPPICDQKMSVLHYNSKESGLHYVEC